MGYKIGPKTLKFLVSLVLLSGFLFTSSMAASSADLWARWDHHDNKSQKTIDYTPWADFLDKYVITKDGNTYVQYHWVSQQDKQALFKAIDHYESLPILDYNANVQFAYWINMYNLLTVELILQHPGVKSIRDIDAKWFGRTGVWDRDVATIDGVDMTLNDIEHRIIRPIWQDPRIHAAVNCASISCPNLAAKPYKGDQIDLQLDRAFSHWVNTPKGVIDQGSVLSLSKIFHWYQDDWGSEQAMRQMIAHYVKDDAVKKSLLGSTRINYQSYDWNLNTLPDLKNLNS